PCVVDRLIQQAVLRFCKSVGTRRSPSTATASAQDVWRRYQRMRCGRPWMSLRSLNRSRISKRRSTRASSLSRSTIRASREEYLTPLAWERVVHLSGPLDLTEVKIAPPAEKIETGEFEVWLAEWGARR